MAYDRWLEAGEAFGWGGCCNHCDAMAPPIHSQTDNNGPLSSALPLQLITRQRWRTTRGRQRQQGRQTLGRGSRGATRRGHDYWDDDGPPSSPADGEDNDAVTGNNQGDATAADVDRGDADAGTSSVVLTVSNTLDHDNNNHDNNANDNGPDAKDAAGK